MKPLDLSRVLAPMVNQSDAPYRALCCKYGATCSYTEMLYSDRIINDPAYLSSMLSPADSIFKDIPTVIQICGNDPDVLRETVIFILDHIDGNIHVHAIDLNLGCPQHHAKVNLFGSYLLDRCHWERVFSCVRAMAQAVHSHDRKYNHVSLYCKIRICDGHDKVKETIDFCHGLAAAGASMICIHGRTRGSARHRRCGPADVDLIQQVASAMKDIVPILLNGNICTIDDVHHNLSIAHDVVGVMSAEGLLHDPALFLRQRKYHNLDTLSTPASTCISSRYELFMEYCELSEQYRVLGGWIDVPKQVSCARQHLMWMLEKDGHGRTVRFHCLDRMRSLQQTSPSLSIDITYHKHVELLAALNDASNVDELRSIAHDTLKHIGASLPYQDR